MNSRSREKLVIIFKLYCQLGPEEELGGSKLRKVMRTHSIDDAKVLQLVLRNLERLGITDFDTNGKKVSSNSYFSQVTKQGKWATTLTAGGLSFHFGHVASLAHSFLSIEEKSIGARKSWEDWVADFLQIEEFIQAWVSDADYDFWQNAKDPLQYEAAGRSYDSLPMKSNGFPPPLEKLEIDTSANPGRRILRSGYVEAVGSTIWLSPLFWERVGMWRKDALSNSGFKLQTLPERIVKVTPSENCFCDGSTKDLQDKVRKVLYG